MKRILVNTRHDEEVRVALVDGQKLYDLDIEYRSHHQKKSNVYKATITQIEPSLEAVFVNFGAERHGFLPLKEISKEYFKEGVEFHSKNIRELLHIGQELIVQVEKEERGNKGAALTTFISLAGRYLVLMPNNARAGGISRRIEGKERAELKAALSKVIVPKGMGIIVRTAGLGRSAEELQWDLDYLEKLWTAIADASKKPAPFLIFQESNAIVRAIRDYLRPDITELVFDQEESYQEGLNFLKMAAPEYAERARFYNDAVPLFIRYQIESQIESAYSREVSLPSGGSIVIDPTEAMVCIDINSSRATKGADIEETAANTNLEAASEIARQLRLRDLGGLVVVDFIDMLKEENQRKVENRLSKALSDDRARVQMTTISRFGLLEMSRQRLRPSLDETTSKVCPRCDGQGTIRKVGSLSLSILRIIEEEVLKDRTVEIQAQVPVEIATFLLNEKREEMLRLERVYGTRLVIIPNLNLETPNYEIKRIRSQDKSQGELSHKIEPIKSHEDQSYLAKKKAPNPSHVKPAVGRIQHDYAPTPKPAKKAVEEPMGLIAKIKKFFAVEEAPKQDTSADKSKKSTHKSNSKKSSKSNNRKSSYNKAGRNGNAQISPSNQKTVSNRDYSDNKSSGGQGNKSNKKNSNPNAKKTKQHDNKSQQSKSAKQDSRYNKDNKDSTRNSNQSRNSNKQKRDYDNANKQRAPKKPVEQKVEKRVEPKPAQSIEQRIEAQVNAPAAKQDAPTNTQAKPQASKPAATDKFSLSQSADKPKVVVEKAPAPEKLAASVAVVETAPVAAAKAEPAKAVEKAEVPKPAPAEALVVETPAEPARAFNDPREIRKRMLEEKKQKEAAVKQENVKAEAPKETTVNPESKESGETVVEQK